MSDRASRVQSEDIQAAHQDQNKRILGLEEENSMLKQRIDTLEGQVENADKESIGKVRATGKSMGFDLGVLIEEILKQARRRQQAKSG